MKKLLFATLFSLFNASNLLADSTPPMVQQLPAEVRIDYLSLNMPNGEPHMGLLGLHYDLNLLPTPEFYSGLGLYSAVQGNQGGVFILGIDNDYRHQIIGPLHLNTGLFIGAAGSANNQPFGGGLVLLPYVGLGYDFKYAALNLNYSHARFTSGEVASSQIMLSLTTPLDFSYFNADDTGSFTVPNDGHPNSWYVSPKVEMMHDNLGLVGFEAGRYFTENFYAALQTMGVAHGNANGYMSLMGGVGYNHPLFQSSLSWTNDILVGAGGGGSIETGNGLLAEADTGLAWNMTRAFTLKLTEGYLASSNRQFKTWVLGVGLDYNLDLFSPATHPGPFDQEDRYAIRKWQINVSSQTLLNPQRTSGSGNLNFFMVDINQFLSPTYYLSYRTAFPYGGSNPNGGNTVEGMIGLGAQPFSESRIQPYFTMLIGAIGGGGISAAGGLIVEPELGLRLAITPGLGLTTSIGRMKSIQGTLDTTILNAGLSFRLGEAERLQSVE